MTGEINKRALTLDQFFLRLALLKAQMSNNENLNAGAVIRNSKNKQAGSGCTSQYVGSKAKSNSGCAEVNALYEAINQTYDSVIYCTHFPCKQCVIDIIRRGIREIVYDICIDDDAEVIEAKEILNSINVSFRQLKPENIDK